MINFSAYGDDFVNALFFWTKDSFQSWIGKKFNKTFQLNAKIGNRNHCQRVVESLHILSIINEN